MATQERGLVNRVLRRSRVILVIVLVGVLLARWTEHVLGRRDDRRRRTQTLYMVTRVSLQVVAVLLILLVVFGPPDNLGTFLGLAGAGLTVALKDFIVGFLGWFVLMGRNGIRIGDLVEINGVTGEVVELGMFYTVLLETGSWNESGTSDRPPCHLHQRLRDRGALLQLLDVRAVAVGRRPHRGARQAHDPYPIVEAHAKGSGGGDGG